MSKPRCHRCGILGYLPGIVTILSVKASYSKRASSFPEDTIDSWHYCTCPAGTNVKHQHTLMQALLPQGVRLVPLIRHGQKAKTSVQPNPIETDYLYRAGKSRYGLDFAKAFQYTDIFETVTVSGKSGMLVSYDEVANTNNFTILDYKNVRTL